MRTSYTSLGAAGNGQWVRLNDLQVAFGVALAGIISSGASLTWKVQHTFDDPVADSSNQRKHPISIARAATVATVTDFGADGTGHGMSIGDSVIITSTGSTNLDSASPNIGSEVATVVDANNYTVTVANTGPTAATGLAQNFRVFDHATLVGQTGRADGNYAYPPSMCRLKVTTYASGRVELLICQGMGR